MRTLSIRIPDALEERLEREAKVAHRKRSDLVREAVGRYLEELERERFTSEMVRAANAVSRDPEIERVAKEFAEAEAEALERAEAPVSLVAETEWWREDDPEHER